MSLHFYQVKISKTTQNFDKLKQKQLMPAAHERC